MPAVHPIMLVDDQPDDLFLIRRLLYAAGIEYPVITASGFGEAQKYLHAAASGAASMPCAIFADLRMPGGDGLALIRWIRTRLELEAVSVVLITAYFDARAGRAAMAAGATACLEKFPPAAILAQYVP